MNTVLQKCCVLRVEKQLVLLTFKTHNQRQLQIDGFAGVGDAFGNGSTVDDATKDVHQNGFHLFNNSST